MLILIFDVLMVNVFYGVNYTPGNWDSDANHTYSRQLGERYCPADECDYYSFGTNWGDQINRHNNFANPCAAIEHR